MRMTEDNPRRYNLPTLETIQAYKWEPKGWRGRSESCQTGSVHRLASAEAKSPTPHWSRRLCQPP